MAITSAHFCLLVMTRSAKWARLFDNVFKPVISMLVGFSSSPQHNVSGSIRIYVRVVPMIAEHVRTLPGGSHKKRARQRCFSSSKLEADEKPGWGAEALPNITA